MKAFTSPYKRERERAEPLLRPDAMIFPWLQQTRLWECDNRIGGTQEDRTRRDPSQKKKELEAIYQPSRGRLPVDGLGRSSCAPGGGDHELPASDDPRKKEFLLLPLAAAATSGIVHVQAIGGGAGERILTRVPGEVQQLGREIVRTSIWVAPQTLPPCKNSASETPSSEERWQLTAEISGSADTNLAGRPESGCRATFLASPGAGPAS